LGWGAGFAEGAGLAGGAGLVAGFDSVGVGAGAGAVPGVWSVLFLGAAVPGKVGMVCLRLAASGSTKGPFCPQAHRAPNTHKISHVRTKHFMLLSITGASP
jgi:hypothetical protein